MKAIVTVCIITYNHEKFIKEAIESVLMQKINFDYEIIIADDCSTDNTRSILIEYKNKHPDLIKLIFQEKNVGAAQNWIDLITAPKSKYIAYLEGDDYWTDSLKLQKQVDFLEKNPDYVACFTNVDRIKNQILQKSILNQESKRDYNNETIFSDNWIPTLTFLFKTDSLKKPLPKEFLEIYTGDAFFFYLIAQNGKIKYLDFVAGVYRFHEGGAWSGLQQFEAIKKGNDSFYKMQKYFKGNKIANKFFKKEIQNNKWKEVYLLSKGKKKNNFIIKYMRFFIEYPWIALKNGYKLIKEHAQLKYQRYIQ